MTRSLMSKIVPIPAALGFALIASAASADVGMAEQFAAWNQSEKMQQQAERVETRVQIAERDRAAGTAVQFEYRNADPHDIFPFGRPE